MNRQRVEDLGRILIHLESVMDSGVFNIYNFRRGHLVERFLPGECIDNEDHEMFIERIDQFQQELEEIFEVLSVCLSIARGDDDLNYQMAAPLP